MTLVDRSGHHSDTRSIARPRALLLLAMVGACALAAVVIRGTWSRTESTALPVVADGGRESGVPTTVAAGPASPQPEAPALFQQSVNHQGIAVEFSIQHVDPAKFRTEELQEGDDVRICFRITDTTGGKPVRNLNPAAWLDLIARNDIRGAKSCEQKVRAFLGGGIFGKAEVDLNVFHVLTLNGEASISVVDPLFSFGGTKLLGMVVLESPGEDWAMTSGETRIFVSMPDSKKVAVVDTASLEVLRNIPLESRPGRIALQPDEGLVWVADDAENADKAAASGVTAIDTTRWERITHMTTGRGPHEIAFSDDGRLAFVTNGQDGTVTLIDTRSLKPVASIRTGAGPVSVAFSPLAKMAYIASGDGAITIVDGLRREVVARIQAEPGLGQIKFAPGGRLGFIVNPARDVVHILDAATNRIVQTADVEDQPYQVAFSDQLAYVRHRGSAEVLMMPLKAVGVEKKPVQVFSFPGGQIPPAKASRLSPADAIVAAPGENAVLVANPMDKSVYYYKEGMAAPMGNFSNYGRETRAVLVVDRSLKERGSPGVYETTVRLRKPGDYDVVFLLDSPRLVHCFTAAVKPNPALEQKRKAGKLTVEHLVERRRVGVGANVSLRFRLTDQQTKAPISGLTDVEVLTNLMPGIWHKRHVASPKDDGVYVLDFVPPRPGLYYIYLQCLSRGLGFNNDQYLILEAVEDDVRHK
jgi:YVTN family beta-propeller protein